MPRVATTINTSNPKRYGYDVRIDEILLRAAVGPGREMQIQSSDVQEGQINVKQNPEDFTSNLGRIYSRNNFTGGQGLDTAHRANGSPKDTTRFFDSKGIDVFHGDDETSYHVHLLHTMESKGLTFTGTEQYVVRTTNGNLYVSDVQTIYLSTDNAASWSTVASTNVSYDIRGMVAFGDNVFVVTGDGSTNKELIHYDGSTWTIESLGTSITGYFTGIHFVKGRLVVTGKSSVAEYLWGANPYTGNFTGVFQTSSALITVEPTHDITSVTDAGAVILAASTDGNIYSLKDNAGTLELKGQSRIGDEEVHSISALEGIIFFGTQEKSTNKGRLYRSDLVVADDLYVLANRQLIKEWNNGVAASPHAMFASRDSIFIGVRESSTETYLWRYYLPTAGLARDLKVPGQGIVGSIKQVEGKVFVLVEGTNGGVYKQTSLYETEGYIITPNIDFFTSEVKQWVGTTVEHDEITDSRRIQCYISTREGTIDTPGSSNWELTNDSTQGFGGTEFQINRNARYLNMKIVLTPTIDFTGTPVFRSVSARALPRPQLVVIDIPVNISDQIERPNRKRIKVRNLGEAVYQKLKQKEGDSVTLELYEPAELIRGVVESVAYPVINHANIGSVTQYCTVRIRGVRAEDITSEFTNIIGIGTLGVVGLG